MRVPQEKCESYAVHFVSANKHVAVLSQICRTSFIYHTSQNISEMHIFLFLKISENMLNFWRGVY